GAGFARLLAALCAATCALWAHRPRSPSRAWRLRSLRDPAPLQRPPHLDDVLGPAQVRARDLLEALEPVAERVRMDDQRAGAVVDAHAVREVLAQRPLQRPAEVAEPAQRVEVAADEAVADVVLGQAR